MIACTCQQIGKFGMFNRLCPVHNLSAAEELKDKLFDEFKWRCWTFANLSQIIKAMSGTPQLWDDNKKKLDISHDEFIKPVLDKCQELDVIIAKFKQS